jgi:hypothetical protein
MKRIHKATDAALPDTSFARCFASCLGVCILLAAIPSAHALARTDCYVGAYRLADGTVVDIEPDDRTTLDWLRLDGTMGTLHRTAGGIWKSTAGMTGRPDGMSVTFPDCNAGSIAFNGVAGRRIGFDVQNVRYRGHGVTLAGRLVMPKGSDKVPVVVLIHGSEDSSALLSLNLQRILPAEGVGVFVYDKRGTGKSTGHYTQDFNLLADDVVASLSQARRLAGKRLGRVGFWGGSEGGWVGPIAANRAHVDFVICAFGLAVNVIDEDQEAVELQMREKGYPPQVIAEAQEVARAAENLFVHDFKDGYRQLDAMEARYGKAPWYKDVRGDFAWIVLGHPDAQLRGEAKEFDWHTPFYYDPMPTLRADRVPQLWIVGGEDYEAPSAETSRRIKSLIDSGLPFTLAYYPHAEHGMRLFDTQPDGTRVSTRYAPGYFAMLRDFALVGHLPRTYADAEITRPREDAPPAATPQSQGMYRLPFADGTRVKIFDDFSTHRPRGRVDIFAIDGRKPYRVVAAAAGRVVAIQDRYSEQQSGRAAALCHNNYVWISHPDGEWTNYSHLAHDSVTEKAHLKVGEEVMTGQYIGDEGAVGCAMLAHVHFEVARPDAGRPIDGGGFLIDNDNGKRELNPRFCGVAGQNAVKGSVYVATPCDNHGG